jgi:hypothetical protein
MQHSSSWLHRAGYARRSAAGLNELLGGGTPPASSGQSAAAGWGGSVAESFAGIEDCRLRHTGTQRLRPACCPASQQLLRTPACTHLLQL